MAAAAGVGRDSLPEHWSYGVCRDGRVFFIDDQRRCTSWLHPRTGEPVNSGHMIRSDLPRGWEEGFSEEGASYFIDHNQQTTTFRHPVTGQFSPENIEFILQEGSNSHMSKQEFMNQRPSSMVSETSTVGTTSTLDMKSGPRVIKTNKIHSFGKRDQSIRRNPNVPVVVRGWLHKQDSSGMRLWKRRWFVLADYCLFYYKDSREEAVLGSIPLPSYVISPVGPEDRINRKYSFKAVHNGMRAHIYNSSGIDFPAEHSGMRTYYFSADTQEDMNGWIRAMNQAALLQSRASLKRDAERTERQAVPQANHTDPCRECGRMAPGHTRDCSQRAHNDACFDRPEQDDEERYGFQRDPLEGKRERGKSKSPYPATEADSFFVDLPSGPRAQSAQPQLTERNGVLPSSFGGGTGLGEQNGTGGYKRVIHPRTNPEKHAQRRSNMAQVENWVKVQKGDGKSLVSDQIRFLQQGPGQSLSFSENYQTLPKNTRHSSGSSPPPLRNLPSDYKYAQDRASHLKMSSEERRAHRDGTVWQLYEWQQRQQFKHGNPTAPIYAGSPEFADQGRSKSMLEVPRSISVPPSPSDIPPLGPPRLFPTRRPHTPAERVTVKPLEQRRSVDISLGGSPRKARAHTLKNSSHVDRRSMPSMGYMTHTVSAPSLHGKSADDTYLQLKKDLEYLDLKMTRDTLKDRSLKPVKVAESDIDVKLSILCEQDRVLQDLEDKIRALKENKDQLESVLEVLHRQMEQYKDQPQHSEKISYQQKLLQEDLVHIRAEISKLSTEMENAWNEYLKLENDVSQLKQTLQRQSRRSFFLPQERSQIQKDLWRIEDVTAGLSTNKANFRILVESFKNPERKTVPLFLHTPVPSVLKSLGTSESKQPPQTSPPNSPPWASPAKTPLEVRLFPQLQTYVPRRTRPLQVRRVTCIGQPLSKLMPKTEDEAPPRPPLPEQYSPEDPPPAVPPLPREATIIRHTSVRGLKRQSDERKRDRELGQCVNGDSKVELRSYMSEPELASLSGDMNQSSLGFVGPDSGYQTLPGRGFSGSTSGLQQSSTIPSYVTLRRGLNADGSKRSKSALERLYSGDHLRGKMSAEEQLERMKRHQKALVRERKRTLSQGEKQSTSHTFSRHSPGDLGSWKREQEFDLQLLERVMQGGEKDEDGWLKVKATPVTEMDLEPQDYDIDISRELSKPDKVSIPERYVDLEPEEPLSLEELEARFRKAEKIRNLLTRSSMHNLQPLTTQDKHRSADLDSQLQEQERIFHISHTLASEASQRSKQVAAQQSALLYKGLPSPSVPQPPLSNGFHYTFV
ncbi:pleckstrin homology domain-containing family A member 7 isoform X4 [Dromiciops gliroides]|uniref:pleckstrin homology domain-containing family A member 7 isoform X4 n=1 Tax=Dromiciops gliroides TaxID=33562 RepID=UPI001CC44A8F|nr:pleckstrin homology domain-containing family A member 7 isoform X4 [Dromiciops gliroides]